MPQIIIETGNPGSRRTAEVLRESANPIDTESGRSRDLLIERISWALRDAEEIERAVEGPYDEPVEVGFNHRSGSIADTALL